MEYLQNLSGRFGRSDSDGLSARAADRPEPLSAGDQHRCGGLYLEGSGKPSPRLLSTACFTRSGVSLTYTLLGAVLIAVLRARGGCFRHSEGNRQMGRNADRLRCLILIGSFMLFGHRLDLPKFGFSGRGGQVGRRGGWGALSARRSFFAGVLSDERGFLFRDADSDVGRRNGRLSPACCIRCRHGAPRGRSSHGSWHTASPGWAHSATGCRPIQKWLCTDRGPAFYSRRYLLWCNLFLLKR